MFGAKINLHQRQSIRYALHRADLVAICANCRRQVAA